MPANLFFSTGIPVCLLVLKLCKKPAGEHFEKGKRQNRLLPEHIDKIVSAYRHSKEEKFLKALGLPLFWRALPNKLSQTSRSAR